MLQEGFLSESISRVEATRIIKEAFPHSQSTQTKSGNRIFGVQLKIPSEPEPSASPSQHTVEVSPQITSDLEQALESERQKTAQLTARIRVLEAMEQQQSQQLKAQSENAHLIQQVDQVARRTTNQVFYGPDTVEHFEAFSIDSIMSELRAGMPDVYRLFATLGKTERNRAADQEGHTPEEMKALMSACILLNAHSNRLKGVQLLMSIMLVARATSKQVSLVIILTQ